jgi:hypothetical protein
VPSGAGDDEVGAPAQRHQGRRGGELGDLGGDGQGRVLLAQARGDAVEKRLAFLAAGLGVAYRLDHHAHRAGQIDRAHQVQGQAAVRGLARSPGGGACGVVGGVDADDDTP